MTQNQPVHYIDILKKDLQEKKVLVFLVPGWRKKEIEKLLWPYKEKDAAIIFRVCTWDDLATLLINSFRCSDLIYEFARDVLRRCRVQSPLKVSDLKDSSKVLAQWLQQRELLEKIRDRLQDEPLFKGMQFPLERKPEWDKEHCYMGITIAPPNALSEKDWVGWIGFWNLFQRKKRSGDAAICTCIRYRTRKKPVTKILVVAKDTSSRQYCCSIC